jgi:hypothetical protein
MDWFGFTVPHALRWIIHVRHPGDAADENGSATRSPGVITQSLVEDHTRGSSRVAAAHSGV